jgi:hypothetical protein
MDMEDRRQQLQEEIAALWDQRFREDPAIYYRDLLDDLLLEDPAERALRLTRHLHTAATWVKWLSDQRDSSICDLRTGGASYDLIAQQLGVDRSRARQLVTRIGASGGRRPDCGCGSQEVVPKQDL